MTPINQNWILRYTGRRGATLLLLSGVDVVIGFSVFTAKHDGFTAFYIGQASICPLWSWAYAWWIVAVILAWSAFKKHDYIGFGVATGFKLLWAVSFLYGQVFYDQYRAWVQAILWFAIAAWLRLIARWPEERSYEH